MDVFIALLVLSAIAGLFVVLVRRSSAHARTPDSLNAHKKPELLTRAQRKALNLPRPMVAVSAAKLIPRLEPNPSTSRAIRTGWSIGVVAFTYEDSAGVITERVVTVHSADSAYLKGECHAKKADRTYRIDRIIGELTDCDTGEVISPEAWAKKH